MQASTGNKNETILNSQSYFTTFWSVNVYKLIVIFFRIFGWGTCRWPYVEAKRHFWCWVSIACGHIKKRYRINCRTVRDESRVRTRRVIRDFLIFSPVKFHVAIIICIVDIEMASVACWHSACAIYCGNLLLMAVFSGCNRDANE